MTIKENLNSNVSVKRLPGGNKIYYFKCSVTLSNVTNLMKKAVHDIRKRYEKMIEEVALKRRDKETLQL